MFEKSNTSNFFILTFEKLIIYFETFKYTQKIHTYK